MPTYVAMASNPALAYQFTGMALTQKYVPGDGHKVYTYWHVDTAQTSPIPMSNVVSELKFSLSTPTNNLYWFVMNNQGKDFGTVGADIQISPSDGTPTLDQFVDINYNGANGIPHDSSLAHCTTATNGYPPTIDSGGEHRWAVYTVFTDPAQSYAYVVTGGVILFRSNGEADMVVLINAQQTTHFNFSSDCTVPSLKFSSQEIDWAVRSPPPFATIPGNYQLYPTTGGNLRLSGGTTALVCLQAINPSETWTSQSSSTTTISSTYTSTTTVSSSTTSSTTATTSSSSETSTTTESDSSSTTLTTQTTATSTSDTSSTSHTTSSSSGQPNIAFSITPLAQSDGQYSNIQTATVTDGSGNPIAGAAVTYYENSGTHGGYFHGTTNSAGQTVVKDNYPGPGSYTEWAVAIVNGQTLTSQKITVIVP